MVNKVSTFIITYNHSVHPNYVIIDLGLWASTVIALIRQDNCSSSFLIGFQRVEGTVIGAVVGFTLFQLLGCQDHNGGYCQFSYITTILVIWNGLSSLFREDPKHGYSAVVAAFTPTFLLLGPALSDLMGAWERVEFTLLGIALYLAIDNLFWPIRSDDSLRKSVVTSINLIYASIVDIKLSIQRLGFVDIPKDDDDKDYKDTSTTHSLSHSLSNEISAQKLQLSLAGDEPVLWHRPLPLDRYESLHQSLELVSKSVAKTELALEAVEKERSILVLSLASQNENIESTSNGNVGLSGIYEVEKLSFLYTHLIDVCSLASTCLANSSEDLFLMYNTEISDGAGNSAKIHKANMSSTSTTVSKLGIGNNLDKEAGLDLKGLFSENDTGEKVQYRNIDPSAFSDLLVLSRSVMRLTADVDEHYRLVYMKQISELDVDTNFVMATQNLTETILTLMIDLNLLGKELFMVCSADKVTNLTIC